MWNQIKKQTLVFNVVIPCVMSSSSTKESALSTWKGAAQRSLEPVQRHEREGTLGQWDYKLAMYDNENLEYAISM